MQRVRMSLPYFRERGWDVEVVTVDQFLTGMEIDPLLLTYVPEEIKVHKVKVLSKKLTSWVGLGSIALRSLWYYRQKVNKLLVTGKFDLIYFSTTQFPLFILGAYWKRKFGIPYIIDMQDPWHSDYYQTKPKHERPKKYWFSYRLNKVLEPLGVKHADGIISVSKQYIDILVSRYPVLGHIPTKTITFGAFGPDMLVAEANQRYYPLLLTPKYKNIVYVGRGGTDMHQSVGALFAIFKDLLQKNERYVRKIKLYFIGTSYAPAGMGKPTILPLAAKYGLSDYVTEITDRIGYYHALATLQQADALFMPGSDDPKYTASKIYPYILTKKPILAIFNRQSPALQVLSEYGVENAFDYENISIAGVAGFLKAVANEELPDPLYNPSAINKYSAREMTLRQCILFDKVLHGKN